MIASRVEMKSTLRWLHITDLHCGMGEGKRLWPNVKEQFFEDLAHVHERSGPLDLVLFTGDLTQRGTAKDFTELEEELDELWEELAKLGSRPVLVAVPGNHDLVRPDAKKPAVRAMRMWHDDAEIRDEFWSAPNCEYRGVVNEAFKEYTAFTARFEAKHPWPTGYTVTKGTEGALPGDLSVSFEKSGVRYALVGLNSAFLQLDGGDHLGRLDLDARQLSAVCGKNYPRWVKNHGVALLLTHHPTSWLHRRALDAFRDQMAPPGRFFAHLFGHMHQSRAATMMIGGADALRETQGSSLLGLEAFGDGATQRMHGYSVGGFDIDGEQGEYFLWPRAAVKHMAGAYQMVLDTSFKLRDERVTERFIPRASQGVAPLSPPQPQPLQTAPAATAPVTVATAKAPSTPVPVSATLSINSAQFEALVKALMAAFPSGASLARLTRFKLDLNLATVATGNLHDQTFALVEWAEAKGRLRDLIAGARQENPGNPTLAAFAMSLGVDVPRDVANVAPPVRETLTITREVREVLEGLYDNLDAARRLATEAGISVNRVDFSGSMQVVWFNLLQEAEKSGQIGALVAEAHADRPEHPALARLAQRFAPSSTAASWTTSTVYDALSTLLPAQFEELVFRLAVPSHFMPGATAPLADRAVALVRIFEQQGRLGEVVEGLERLGVRPARG